MFETFDHTADLGLRIRAADLDTLFAEAARGLFCTIVDDLESVAPAERFDLQIAGEDNEYLFFDWLRELLYRFDAEHRLFSKFEVRMNESGLTASVWGESYDPEKHELCHEVKAITYHGLKVEKLDDGWLAEVIVDI
jgi:SHS2 domain-containing protein